MSTTFSFGDLVKVATPVGTEDKRHRGVEGSFVRYAQPHGYAVVRTEKGDLQLHPESLDLDLVKTAQERVTAFHERRT